MYQSLHRTLTFHGNPMYFGGVPSTGKSVYLRRTEQISSADFIGCVKSLTVNGHERRLFKDSYNATGIRDTCNQVHNIIHLLVIILYTFYKSAYVLPCI